MASRVIPDPISRVELKHWMLKELVLLPCPACRRYVLPKLVGYPSLLIQSYMCYDCRHFNPLMRFRLTPGFSLQDYLK